MLLDKHVWRAITFRPRTSGKDCSSNAQNEKCGQQFASNVKEGSWNRKKLPFKPLSSNDLLDFPEICPNDFKILFTVSNLLLSLKITVYQP